MILFFPGGRTQKFGVRAQGPSDHPGSLPGSLPPGTGFPVTGPTSRSQLLQFIPLNWNATWQHITFTILQHLATVLKAQEAKGSST